MTIFKYCQILSKGEKFKSEIRGKINEKLGRIIKTKLS